MNLFVYGTLLSRSVFEGICGHWHPPEPAHLPGFRCEIIQSRDYPGITPDPDASVDGAVYRDLTDRDLTALDSYEGHEYLRRSVCVILNGSTQLSAQAYIVKSPTSLSGQPWVPFTA